MGISSMLSVSSSLQLVFLCVALSVVTSEFSIEDITRVTSLEGDDISLLSVQTDPTPAPAPTPPPTDPTDPPTAPTPAPTDPTDPPTGGNETAAPAAAPTEETPALGEGVG